MTTSNVQVEAGENLGRRASYLILITMGILLGIAIGSTVVRGNLDTLSSFGLSIGFVILAFRARRGVVRQSVLVSIFVAYILFYVATLLISGVGISLALLGFMIQAGLITQTMPNRQIIIYGGIFFTSSILLIFLDLFWPIARVLILPGQSSVILVSVIVATLIALWVVFRRYTEYSIQIKFTVVVAFLGVMALSFITILIVQNVRSALEDNVEQELQNNALFTSRAVGELLAQQLNTMKSLRSNQSIIMALEAVNSQYENLNEEQIVQELRERDQEWQESGDKLAFTSPSVMLDMQLFKQTFPNIEDVLIIDKHGGLIAFVGGLPQSFYYGQEAWWQQISDDDLGSVYIGNPVSTELNNYVIDLAVPLYDSPQEEFVGVAYASYPLTRFTELLDNSTDDPNQIDLLIGREAVYNFTNGSISETSNVPEDLLQLLEAQDNPAFGGGLGLASSAPVESFSGTSEVVELDWQIIVQQDQTVITDAVNRQQRTQVIVNIVIILIGTVAAFLVSGLISQPILELTDVAQRVERGERDARSTVQTGDELGLLATAFNQMVSELQTTERDLEGRVSARTRALETSVRVSRDLSQIVDRDQLLINVVDQLQESFNYYHVHIYLLSPDSERLDMVGGSGEVGQIMLAQEHHLRIGQGLVGRAVSTNAAVLVPDVSLDEQWVPNPLLPDTQAEIAVPISTGERVQGALDVQNNIVRSLSQQDVDILQSIANQIAVALRNAELYSEVQQEAEREQLINQIGQKIQNTTDVESAMKVAVRELGQVLRVSQTSVRLQTNKPNGQE